MTDKQKIILLRHVLRALLDGRAEAAARAEGALRQTVPSAVPVPKEMLKRQTWTGRVRQVYSSYAELKAYDSAYNLADRLGYTSAYNLWCENPLIGGSTNPDDYGVVSS